MRVVKLRPLVSHNDDRTVSIEWWGPRHVVHVMLTRYRWWIQVYVGKGGQQPSGV